MPVHKTKSTGDSKGEGMKFDIEMLKEKVGNSRTKDDALKVLELLSELFTDSEIEMGKVYYVSEWSWRPICDGNFPCKQTIRYKRNMGGINVYATGTSHRTYFVWDLFETEEACKEICYFKNSFGYDWEIAVSDFRKMKQIPWDFYECFGR